MSEKTNVVRRGDPFPCGCVLLFDNKKTYINGVDMSHMISNVCDIERCEIHQKQWDASMEEWVRKMDEEWIEQAMQKWEEEEFGQV